MSKNRWLRLTQLAIWTRKPYRTNCDTLDHHGLAELNANITVFAAPNYRIGYQSSLKIITASANQRVISLTSLCGRLNLAVVNVRGITRGSRMEKERHEIKVWCGKRIRGRERERERESWMDGWTDELCRTKTLRENQKKIDWHPNFILIPIASVSLQCR